MTTSTAIDPQIVALLDKLPALGYTPIHTLSPAAARAQFLRVTSARGGEPEPVASVSDRTVPGPARPIPVRIYRDAGDAPRPLLVYYHGGGYVIGDLDTHDSICRSLALASGCVVASVDYRLAPEHRFPAAADDAYAALEALAADAAGIGARPDRIAVGGDSAGGNLAAVCALLARERGGPEIAFQLLVYPVTDFGCDTGSYRRFATGFGTLEAASMRWFRDHYLRDEADRQDWRAAPLRATDLGRLPPAWVLTASLDVLRDEGVAYARRLREAGVPVEHLEQPGTVHGYFGMAPNADVAVAAIRAAGAALAVALA